MPPRVVLIGLASDYGCQVQITNTEDHLLDVLGTIDLSYWQLALSGHLPKEYDIAIIEGSVTTDNHVELLKSVRATAPTVIAIGACAVSGGIPGIACQGVHEDHLARVYDGAKVPAGSGGLFPAPVSSVINIDYQVPGCPIQPDEFIAVLQRAMMGLANRPPREPLCAQCKISENACFFENGSACLGLVTRTGCGALCVSLGKPCAGCRGIADDANLAAAREVFSANGINSNTLDSMLALYNSASESR